MKFGMLLVKGPMDTKAGSDTGKYIGMPPNPTALTLLFDVFNFKGFVYLFVCFFLVKRKLPCLPGMMWIFHSQLSLNEALHLVLPI